MKKPRFLSCVLTALLLSSPAAAQSLDGYDQVYALASDALKKNLLTESQAKALKQELTDKVRGFRNCCLKGGDYLPVLENQRVLAAFDQPYDLLEATRLDGKLDAVREYLNGAGPGMSGVIGSPAARSSYWGNGFNGLTSVFSTWQNHVAALVSAYRNAPEALTTTPLMTAIEKGDLREAKRLLQAGADVNALTYQRWSPLMSAVCLKDSYPDMAVELISRGANVNNADRELWTPLMCAADNGLLDIVKLLVEKGADIKPVNDNGKTALALAEDKKHGEVAAFLRSRP